MKTIVKIGIIAGLAYLVVWGIGAAKTAASKFHFDITGYGKPSMSNWVLTVPITVTINNPTPLPVNADRVVADLYILKGNQWVPAAHLDQAVTVPPGETQQIFNANANIASIFGGNVFSTLSALLAAYNNKRVEEGKTSSASNDSAFKIPS